MMKKIIITIFVLCVASLIYEKESRNADYKDLSTYPCLNSFILDELNKFKPKPNFNAYHPRGGPGSGCSRDIVYDNRIILKADPQGCYCSGTTLEIFDSACNSFNASKGIPNRFYGFTNEEYHAFCKDWYGHGDQEKTNVTAFSKRGCGFEIKNLHNAKPGDIVQLWRNNGVGHNAIFMKWEYSNDKKIVGIHFWSSQGSTQGYANKVEFFGEGRSQVNINRTYVVRAYAPDIIKSK